MTAEYGTTVLLTCGVHADYRHLSSEQEALSILLTGK
jgi:hypothetical protein